MNCNEKELKAKLYNNRAIAHFKLGKMMRALICIFLSSARAFSSFSEKGDNFEYMSKNKKSEKIYMPYLGFSNIQRAIHKFFLKLLYRWWEQIIRDIYFQTGHHQDSLRDAEAANELNPTFLKAIVRG